MSLTRPVRVLPPEVARKIAAGEVIDRPNAIVRELMDNAIDSGATSITVEIYGGGIDKIRVVDNGSGMSKQDLEIASTPHATSKISCEQDLLSLDTLGFRGEALSSIAAVSKLTIISDEYKLDADVILKNKISACTKIQGTIVQSENLFANFPARRLFLKRPGTESKMCQTTFIEKALAFNNIEFRFYQDGELKLDFPKVSSLKERFINALSYEQKKDLFFTLKNTCPDEENEKWSYELIIGEPSIYRNDRKEINIYVNNRKIIEYSLLQAIEYGVQGFFPNGTHPVATIFISIDSKLVDFNIHPAKKEVRFKDISTLHHSISSTVENFFKDNAIKSVNQNHSFQNRDVYENSFNDDFFTTTTVSQKTPNYLSKNLSNSDARSSFLKSNYSNSDYDYAKKLSSLAQNDFENNYSSQNKISQISNSAQNLKYLGTTLGVFLLVEKNDTLYFIDQHAAHERILYNKIMSETPRRQKLLVPYELESQSISDDEYLNSIKEKLSESGFLLKNCNNGKWQITEILERWTGSQQDLQKIILDDKVAPEKIISHIAATTACKAAIKDGAFLDEQTAFELAQAALSLPDPHCPHGRPIWWSMSKSDLFNIVRRTE